MPIEVLGSFDQTCASAAVTNLLLSTRPDLLERCQRFVNGLLFGNTANSLDPLRWSD